MNLCCFKKLGWNAKLDDAFRRLSDADAQYNNADAAYLALKTRIESDVKAKVNELFASDDFGRYFPEGGGHAGDDAKGQPFETPRLYCVGKLRPAFETLIDLIHCMLQQGV